MKIQVDDDTELANSVKLSESEREALGKADDEEITSTSVASVKIPE